MKPRPGKRFWAVALILALAALLACLLAVLRPTPPDPAAVKALADTRQSLRARGFKTDLADFDFSTPPEAQAREAMLQNVLLYLGGDPRHNLPDLMAPVGNDSAAVVWTLDSVTLAGSRSLADTEPLSWEAYRALVDAHPKPIDAAAAAVLAGPIRFNLAGGQGGLRLPHLALIRNLSLTFAGRSLLALHDGDLDEAWTNLMAATRLVTAWEPEPVEVSHSVRFAGTAVAFNALWQALQTNGWPEARLASLQREWEAVDFFTNLPAIARFDSASAVANQEAMRADFYQARRSFVPFAETLVLHPLDAWLTMEQRQQEVRYNQRQSFEDEEAAMLYYCDREAEMRTAVQAPTWSAMRSLPGVTNAAWSNANRRGRSLPILDRQILVRGADTSLLARAAQAETQRRLIVIALALARYHQAHGAYPEALPELAPEFVKAVPADFMNGQPLHYRLAEEGHFLLYSVGLDGVDNGGKMRRRISDPELLRQARRDGQLPAADIVWPRPAGPAARQVEQQIQSETKQAVAKARAAEQKHYLTEISDREWKESPARQSRVARILAMNWSDASDLPPFKGQSVESFIRNPEASGTNPPSLLALLTPKQILTVREPEDLTFQFPIRYDVITNNHSLFMMVDAETNDVFAFDSGGKVCDCERATNGDCLVVWHALYDPPGRHAVQAHLILWDKREGTLTLSGPAIAVTTSNLCQFSLDCVNYDVAVGARFHARLPEKNGIYSIECLTTNGAHLATLTGRTASGEFNVVWNLQDEHGRRLEGEPFHSVVRITLPDSGRAQTLRGP